MPSNSQQGQTNSNSRSDGFDKVTSEVSKAANTALDKAGDGGNAALDAFSKLFGG